MKPQTIEQSKHEAATRYVQKTLRELLGREPDKATVEKAARKVVKSFPTPLSRDEIVKMDHAIPA
jgi:hypothetical protein